MGKKNNEQRGKELGRVVAAFAAAAMLLGGGVIAPTAFADDAPATTQSQDTATTPAPADSSKDAAKGSEKTVASVDDPALIRGVQGDANLALPKTVTVHYSDSTSEDLSVTWSGDGYESDADLAKLNAGTYKFTGTVAGTDKQPTVTLELAKPAVAPESADSQADKKAAAAPQTEAAPQADSAAEGKTVASIEPVDLGTEAVGITPELYGVNVVYTDGSQDYLYPTWGKIDSSKAGTVTVEGTINGVDAKAKATVKFVDVKSIEKPTVYALAGQYANLPYQVKVTLTDGTELGRDVNWNNNIDWSATKNGDVKTVSGTLNNSTLTTTATVNVSEVTSYEKVEVKTLTGVKPSLPSQVTANLANGKTADFNVTWDDIDASKYAQAGTFTVEGSVDGASKKAAATVTVQGFKAFESVFVTTAVGSQPSLPYQVRASLDDGTVKDYQVTWDSVDPSQYAKAGTFEVSGSVVDGNYQPTSVKVKATVQVLPIRSVESPTVYTVPGVKPELPSSVYAYLSDGSSVYEPVTWESFTDAQYQNAGEFTVKGTVQNAGDIFSVATVRVVPITKLNESTVSTLVGRQANLPSSISATFADGRTDGVNVTWETVADSKWNQTGKFDVIGTVAGTDLKAVAHVTVAGLKTTKYTLKTYVGGGFRSPGIELTDGTTSYNYDAEWDSKAFDSESYAKPGEFDVNGKIKGTDLTITVHVVVLAIKSIAQPAPVTTVTGVAPDLPSSAYATLSDNSQWSFSINWKAVDPSQYANPGTFSVEGTISELGRGVKVTVSVYDSQKSQEVSVSTLREFKPELPYQVTTTLWNGTRKSVNAQWETPDPASYAKTGSFDVKGYIQGSDIPLVAHVNVYDAADPVVQNVTTVVGVAPQYMSNSYLTVKLTNGDTYQTPYDSTITWANIDPSQYAKAGEFNVEGTFIGKSIKLYTHVVVGKVYSWYRQSGSYKIQYVIGSGDLELPTSFVAVTEDGSAVSLPVTWGSYDKSQLKQDGAKFTVNGKATGANNLPTQATVSVLAVKSTEPIDDVITIAGTAPNTPSVYGKLSDGSKYYLSTQWDDIDPSQYAKAGTFTVNGKAGASYNGEKNIPVSYKVRVVSDIASADAVDSWTVPGVAPSLPSYVSVDYPKSLAARVGGFFKSVANAVTGAAANDEVKPTLPVTWDGIDPAKYAKDGSEFTVEGTIQGSKVKAKATVKVSGVKTVKLPNYNTVAGRQPILPYTVNVATNDGGTHQVSIRWDNIPPSDYAKEGATFTVNGQAYLSGASSSTDLMTVSVRVNVTKVNDVMTSALDGLVTEVGIEPMLFSTLPVHTSSGQVLNAAVNWDKIPPAKYAKPGEFEVSGTVPSNNNAKVSVKVKVIAKQDKPVVSVVDFQTQTITPGDTTFELPKRVAVYMSDGTVLGVYGGAASLSAKAAKVGETVDEDQDGTVTWDTSGVDFNKPGNYDITGTIKGISKKAHFYLTVADTAAGTLEGFVPVTKQIAAGTSAKDAAAALPQQVTAKYSDGSTKLASVDWDLTPLTDEALAKVGAKIALSGTVSGTAVKAKAAIEVVAPDAVPNQPEDVTVNTLEGDKPQLPETVTITYKDGRKVQSPVKWDEFGDDQWADGVGDTSFDVSGITEVGAFTVTAHVNVKKAKKYTVTLDANGGKLAAGVAATTSVREGKAFAEPKNPARAGYVFVGWFDAAKGGKSVSFPYKPTGDTLAVTLYAHWTKKPVPATGVTLSGDGIKDGKVTLTKGSTLALSATVTPADATNRSVTWSSSDASVASVAEDGTVTALKGGKATIKATTVPLASDPADKAETATVTITVPRTAESVVKPQDVLAALGRAPKLPATVTVVYDDGSQDAAKVTWNDTTDWAAATEGQVVELNGVVDGVPDNLKNVKITVTVVTDTEAPTFSGVDDKSITVGTEFDPLAGVKAVDNVDGNVTGQVKVKGKVDTNKVGKYTLTYTVSDESGNTATAKRTITVTAKPVEQPKPTQPGASSKPGASNKPAGLPDTGAISNVAAVAALLLAAAGASIKLIGERRREARGRHLR